MISIHCVSLKFIQLHDIHGSLLTYSFDFVLVPQELLLKMNANSIFVALSQVQGFVNAMNQYAFENVNVQKFIHSTEFEFDVIINEEFFADSFLMFGHKFKAPLITICKCLSVR